MSLQFVNYWHWLFKGSGGRSGLRRLLDRWLFLHLAVGLGLAALVQKPLAECANSVLLPLAGAIIGLSFAWAGNAQALLQTSEIEDVADKAPGGLVEYAYVYQTAILLILIALVGWTVAGLSVFDSSWPTPARTRCYYAARASLFCLSSVALRECWHVVLGAQWMLLIRREIRRSKGDQEKRKQ